MRQETPGASPPRGREALRTLLHGKNLRSTPSRLAVLELLIDAQGPLSHAEVAVQLMERGFDRATLYRNLTDFVDAGLASRADRGDHIWRFEFKRSPTHDERSHPHFVCNDCGAVSCLPELTLPVAPANPAGKPIIRTVSEIVIKGQCQDCP